MVWPLLAALFSTGGTAAGATAAGTAAAGTAAGTTAVAGTTAAAGATASTAAAAGSTAAGAASSGSWLSGLTSMFGGGGGDGGGGGAKNADAAEGLMGMVAGFDESGLLGQLLPTGNANHDAEAASANAAFMSQMARSSANAGASLPTDFGVKLNIATQTYQPDVQQVQSLLGEGAAPLNDIVKKGVSKAFQSMGIDVNALEGNNQSPQSKYDGAMSQLNDVINSGATLSSDSKKRFSGTLKEK